MNWVDRRARHKALLEEGIPQLWIGLLSALEESVKSYNDHFGADGRAEFKVLDDMKAVVAFSARQPGSQACRVEVRLDGFVVEVSDGSELTLDCSINGHESPCFGIDGVEYDPDAASERILAPVLFGDAAALRT